MNSNALRLGVRKEAGGIAIYIQLEDESVMKFYGISNKFAFGLAFRLVWLALFG